MEFDKKFCLVLLLLAVAFASEAQVNRYMVFFKDKSGTAFSVSRPSDFLSAKAITRRIQQGIEVTEADLPVNSNYVDGVKSTGASVFFRSKWFNGLLVQCDQSLIPSIQALSFVDRVEYVAPKPKLLNPGRKKFNLKRKEGPVEMQTANQLTLIGINSMHQAGHYGEGMTIAMLDAGFPGVDTTDAFSKLREENRIDLSASHDFIANSGNVFQYDEHGTEVLSTITAEIPDAFTGGAPRATFQLYVTEDGSSEYRIEEYNWAFAAERADSAGADIINSSLGYYDFDDTSMNYTKAQMDGKTTVVTKAAQWAADRGIVVVCSAGNEGNITSWRIITAPADAKDVIAVASVDFSGVRSSSSSIGPAADGRIKPDLAAMGVGTKIIKGTGALSSASGTSLAAPLITALVAGVWERYPELTNKEVIDVLRKTASLANAPNNLIGYGIPNFKSVVNYQEQVQQEKIFEVYPNPVTDTVVVSPIHPDTVSSCFVELVNPLGQVISSKNVDFSWYNRNFQSNLTGLSPGVYFIRVLQNDKKYVFKVVKQ
jgi:serine protease AprX